MIYLQREETEFTRTKKVFEEQFYALLERMLSTFKAKGKTRDTGSPIHHRLSPDSLLSNAQSKCRRIESILSLEQWQKNPKHLVDLIEESVDIANYVLYLAALCNMLEKEIEV